jgi:ATP-dependent RNA helicase SUPV3L1/SUV3
MSRLDSSAVTAVLGPTNTGKTHLAVERLCAHSSGIMGFPLRLLAREIYDRVVAIKGPKEVGLITGEERIMPPGARWLLSTVESMPIERDVAFVAIDEAQLAADRERGHVFTDRILRARGREETMILGSDPLRPMIRALLPEAEIIQRPRFSQLNYAGAKKLSRLPPRSVIVAFSAEQVYAVAEALRRTRGGAAVVMGALSPRTRNAQVAMFQSGEVDYLVATDAIGMGLNLDVGHVAFASLSKFDGQKQRRLTIPEIAQIAGRAGRHQRDGTFGVLADGDGAGLSDVEIERVEDHRFAPIDHLNWRNHDLDFDSIEALVASLEVFPQEVVLRPAAEAVDLAVLRALGNDFAVRDAARHPAMVARLWSACSLPDFRKLGVEHHARLVAMLFEHLSSGKGHIPHDLIAREVTRLESVEGDIESIAGRMSAARTWAYIANRADWLADPKRWADRTEALEEKLSDALHRKLTERFVDRRTSILMRALADEGALDVVVEEGGTVCVEDEPIGSLSGFRFIVDPTARSVERKRLLAAAEQRLPKEFARRAVMLANAPDAALMLRTDMGEDITILWGEVAIAHIQSGKSLIEPQILVDSSIRRLPSELRQPIEARLAKWLSARVDQKLASLVRMAVRARDPQTPPPLRAILTQLVENGGLIERHQVETTLAMLDAGHRRQLHHLGFILGSLDLFHPATLKPEAAKLRIALTMARAGKPMPPLPMPGLGLLDAPSASLAAAAQLAGYRRFGGQMIRVDLVERIARSAHEARKTSRAFSMDAAFATSIGVGLPTLALVLRALGFHPVTSNDLVQWRWSGRPRRKTQERPINAAFAALQALKR